MYHDNYSNYHQSFIWIGIKYEKSLNFLPLTLHVATSVDLYFWSASMISIFALILFIEIRKMPYAVYHFRQMKQFTNPDHESSPLLPDPESTQEENVSPSFETPSSLPPLSEVKIWEILKKIWP